MRKLLVGAMALGFFTAIAVAGAAERHPSVGVKADGPLEVGSQLRRYRRAYYRLYRGYGSPLYGPRYLVRGASAPGYYPAWYTPYYDYGSARPGYGYYRPFISIGGIGVF